MSMKSLFVSDLFEANQTFMQDARAILGVKRLPSILLFTLHLTLITTYGLKFNEHAGRIQKVITMDDLLRI